VLAIIWNVAYFGVGFEVTRRFLKRRPDMLIMKSGYILPGYFFSNVLLVLVMIWPALALALLFDRPKDGR